MKHTTDLGKDKVPLLVLKLAIPSMIAQFVTVLYSIIDRMFIGNIEEIGDIALAGVGVCGPIVTLLTSFGTLIGLGGSILMAMRMGAGQKKEAQSILAHSFAMLVAFSAVLTLVFLLSKKYLLNWFGASPLTFPYADTYMTIYTAGTFFALMAIGLNYFITCQGFPAVGMCTVLIGAITNIVLDPVFIFVLYPKKIDTIIAKTIKKLIIFPPYSTIPNNLLAFFIVIISNSSSEIPLSERYCIYCSKAISQFGFSTCPPSVSTITLLHPTFFII